MNTKQIKLIIYLVFLINMTSVFSTNSILNTLVTKYEAIVENVEIDAEGRMRATKEISTNRQMLIIPTVNVMSSEENYQFKEYFSRSSREKLVGRLLIERFVGNESYYHSFIDTLPQQEELQDYYHYSDSSKEEFNKRSLIKYTWADRRNDYDSLIRKIPTNEIPSLLLNWELFNWAHSIVNMYGVVMKKKYLPEVKRLTRVSNEMNPNDDIALVPGINLFKNGPFKSLSGNNLLTSLFAYKEHIYLNSDRYIDEGEQVFNEVQFLSNVKLFEISGNFIKGFHHEEMYLTLSGNDWTLKKFNLCKELECLPKSKASPHFILKYEFNHFLLNYCQIDQMEDKDDALATYKILKMNRKVSDLNYLRSLAKCSRVIKEYLKFNKKTTISKDLSDLTNNKYKNNQEKSIISFAFSQKKILYYHIKMFNNRLIKEMQNEVFTNFKNKYV